MGWALVYFELSDEECGHLLERDEETYAYEGKSARRVPAFRNVEGALLFLRQQEPTIATLPVELHYDITWLDAFIAGTELAAAPDANDANDAWTLLLAVSPPEDERDVAAAAEIDDLLEAGEDLSASETEALRTAMATALARFRSAIEYL
jgi:hypothetical protein